MGQVAFQGRYGGVRAAGVGVTLVLADSLLDEGCRLVNGGQNGARGRIGPQAAVDDVGPARGGGVRRATRGAILGRG